MTGNGKNGHGLSVVQTKLEPVDQDYVTAHDLRTIAEQLTADRPETFLHLRNFNVAYLFRKGTPPGIKEAGDDTSQIHTIAKAFKSSPLWLSLTGFHAGVWVWEWWWERFQVTQRQALTMHEILHIGRTDSGAVRIEKHDLEDFALVVGTYGRWMTGVELYAGQLELFDRAAAVSR